jgi:hypothetical protein
VIFICIEMKKSCDCSTASSVLNFSVVLMDVEDDRLNVTNALVLGACMLSEYRLCTGFFMTMLPVKGFILILT